MKSLSKNISILYRYSQKNILTQLKPIGIGSGTYLVLLCLYDNEGISQDEIANLTEMDKSTITRAITQLETKGFAIREFDKSDKRLKRVFTTERARDIHNTILMEVEKWNNSITENLSSSEKQEVAELLNKMASNASKIVIRKI